MKSKIAGFISLLAVNGMALSTIAQAQVVPDAGKFIREIETAPVTDNLSDAPKLVLPQSTPTQAVEPGGPSVLVTHVQVTGAEAFDTPTLEALVADLVGQTLTLAELQAGAARITQHYRAHGYFLSRAYLPEQDVSEGVITIAVLEGRLGEIHVNNSSRLRTSIVEAPLKPLQPGQMITATGMETPLLRLVDVTGGAATTTLVPGTHLGTSDLNVDIAPIPWVSGTVELDNFGNRYTGKHRLGASLRVKSPFGLADRFDLRVLGSDEEQVFFRAQYALAVGPKATELGAAYSDMDYELAGEFADIGATGNAQIATAFVRQSLIRSRTLNLEAQLQYDRKNLEDLIATFGSRSDKDSELVTLTFAGDLRDTLGGGGITRASLAYTHGDLTLNSYLNRAIDSVTAQSAGSFYRWTPSIMRLQNLGGNWSLHGQVHGQFASKNLDSSEKLSLGGAYGVRAYPQGEASGDEGWIANLELRYDVNPRWQAFALVDHGEVDQNKNPWDTSDNDRTLSGAGLGVRWNDQSLRINATLATPIGSEHSRFDDKDYRAWAQIIWQF